jgi:hypothetical protein
LGESFLSVNLQFNTIACSTETSGQASRGLGDAPALIGLARKDADEWRTDPEKRQVPEARLAEHGYDEVALNAGLL